MKLFFIAFENSTTRQSQYGSWRASDKLKTRLRWPTPRQDSCDDQFFETNIAETINTYYSNGISSAS